jgi:uncharacterized membrane-anchored protein YitT (DUF2179 family)
MKKVVKEHITVVVASLILAVAFNATILPLEIVIGGSSGLSIIAEHMFGVPPFVVILICYAGALICGYVFLGKKKIKKSIFGTIVYPLFIFLTSPLTDYVKSFSLDTSEYLIIVIFGAVISGIAYGLVYRIDCTTGGSDIASQIINKYSGVSIGSANTIINVIIVIIGGFVFGWAKVLYAILTLYIIGIVTDRVLLGMSYSKQFYIITDKDDDVKQFLFDEFNLTVTELDVVGGYTNNTDQILMCVVPTSNYFELKEGINAIDENAFFIVTDAYELNERA